MTHSTTSDVDGGFSHLGLTGKLIIKAQLGNDIRKTPINNEEITYDELILMMARLFKGKFDVQDDVLLKYRDEDGDLVTIADDSDLKFAIQCNRVLKISIFLNGQDETVQQSDVNLFKTDLHQLMEKANSLLESIGTKLQNATVEASPAPLSTTSNVVSPASEVPLNQQPATVNKFESTPEPQTNALSGQASNETSKEFDPLSRSLDDKETKSISSQPIDAEVNSVKSLDTLPLNDRSPATIQPSVQQYQVQTNAPPKPIASTGPMYPPQPTLTTSTPFGVGPPTSQQQGHPAAPQPMYRYPVGQPSSQAAYRFNQPPPPQGQQPPPPQTPTQQQPPLHPGNFIPQGMQQQQPPQQHPQQQPPQLQHQQPPPPQMMQGGQGILQQQQQQRGAFISTGMPPQGAPVYPTPSSTPGPVYPPPPMSGQPPMSGPSSIPLNQPPQSNPLGPPPSGAMGVPPQAGAPPMGPPPAGGNPYARANARGYMYPNTSFSQ